MVSMRSPGERADVEVIEISDGDYAQAVETALAELGLTYRQLEAQARKGQFTGPCHVRLVCVYGGGEGMRLARRLGTPPRFSRVTVRGRLAGIDTMFVILD